MISIDDQTFENLKKGVDFSSLNINERLLSDDDLRRPLERYLILTHFAEKLSNVEPLQIYYNRYYWFLKFNDTYLKKYGKDDLNLRQQIFKIIEEGQTYPNIDWKEIEKILKSFELDIQS